MRVEIVPHPHPCRQLKKATSQGDLTVGSCDQPEWEDHTHNTNSVAVTSNEAYGRGGSTPATPPVPRAPPPPYPGTARGNQSNVRSIHEYDYIGDRS